MAAKNKQFIYGIASVYLNDSLVGYIEKDSFEWGGTKPDSVDVEAEQVPDAPVLTLYQKNGQIAPTFNLIQLDYENIAMMVGGTLVGSTGAYTGWQAPTDLTEITGDWKINTVSGQTIHIPNGTMMANFDGKLAMSEVSKLACQLKANKPEDGSAAFEIYDTED